MARMLANKGHPLLKGCMAWWLALPHISGGSRFVDMLGRWHGARTNGPAWQGRQGRIGGRGSLEFAAASSQYIDGGAVPLDSNNWTVMCWMANRSANITRVFSWHGDGPTIYKTDTGNQPIGIVHSGTIDMTPAGITAFDGSWHHIAITRSGSNAAVLIDGKVATSSTSFSATYTANSQVRMGGSSAFAEYLTGALDDCSLFNRGLSTEEVTAWYRRSQAGYPGLILRRRVDAIVPAEEGSLIQRRLGTNPYCRPTSIGRSNVRVV